MKYIVLIAFQISALFIYAQGNINGKINDQNGLPLIGANIVVENTTIGTTTDVNGKFKLQVDKLPVNIKVTYIGFQPKTIQVKNQSFLTVSLSESVDIKEVTVESKVNTTELSMVNPLQVQKISSKELQKAACCNLSESFETNATVDVSFTDAVSGAKQIQMLGLDGIYTQITQENVPLIRGLSSAYGLTYVPGTWIESIQIIKGAGSVINGFESFAGQINLEYFKPENADKIYWNFYTNSENKFENNLQFAKKTGKWTSNLFTSINYHSKEVDENENGFLDMPHIKSVNVLNRWLTETESYRINLVGRVLVDEREGGQIRSISNPYKVLIDNTLLEFNSKTGLKMPDKIGKSVGLQTAFRRHDQAIKFGLTDYNALQESAFLNLIGQTYISTTDHSLKYGISYYADRYTENYESTNFDRVDLTTGIFTEYSYTSPSELTIVAGIRGDYHNTHGFEFLPRLNLKYNPSEQTVVRLSAGKAMRVANPIAENTSYFASSREFEIQDSLGVEVAWNYGVNFTHCFKLFEREASFNADAYRTDFENQVIVDIEDPTKLRFYNLDGESYSNSIQFDFNYELFDRFDVKLAYKINQVYSTYDGEKMKTPLVPENRALINFAYATDHINKWMFDATWNYIGESRIPYHPLIKDNKTVSDPFYVINSQVTKKFKTLDIYLGGENLLNYKQENPILGGDDPFGSNFDASIIWAPVMGRLIYTGIRLKIN
ncbi:MAG: TonB-dependent receptor [Flavobacteriales bacterium]|nr:TonB-dependent receptor [Flavobacteriales bacterium]